MKGKINMTRRSKYEALVNEDFVVEYKGVEYQVTVLDTRMIEKVSKKTGRTYKVRRLWVCLGGSANEFEIGTQSWNKKSFMKNLLKSEGVDFVVKNESKKEESKKSTIRIENGTMYGTIVDLVHWGLEYNLWKKYKAKYKFENVKEEIEQIYEKARKTGNTFRANRALNRIKEEVRLAMRDYVEIEDAEANGTLEIDIENLDKLARATQFDAHGHKVTQLCDAMISKLRDPFFRSNIFSDNSNSSYDTFNYDWLYNFLMSKNSSKYGFDKCTTQREVKSLYRKLSKELHPDLGGDQNKFIEMNNEYNSAMNRFA